MNSLVPKRKLSKQVNSISVKFFGRFLSYFRMGKELKISNSIDELMNLFLKIVKDETALLSRALQL